MSDPAEDTHPMGKVGGAAAVGAGAPAVPPALPAEPDATEGVEEDNPDALDQPGETREQRMRRRRAPSGGRVRKKAPRGPPRPQGAYMQFLAHFRVQEAAELEGMQAAEIGRRAGAAWRNMTNKEKALFQDKAETDKVRFGGSLWADLAT